MRCNATRWFLCGMLDVKDSFTENDNGIKAGGRQFNNSIVGRLKAKGIRVAKMLLKREQSKRPVAQSTQTQRFVVMGRNPY